MPNSTVKPVFGELAGDATLLYYLTDEAQEGKNAFLEKRKPDFKQYPKFP